MHGFEREGIRITSDGHPSPKSHPPSMGYSLTHPFITTDFCEPQLEIITPPTTDLDGALNGLNQILLFVSESLEEELIWPFSMPPCLPKKEDEIPLAVYGTSELGQEKTTYRNGIGLRYGRRRLTISGAHYSFSFDDSPLKQELLSKCVGVEDGSNFDPWLHVTRNLYRALPFFTYLFGASPAFDKSFDPGFTTHIKSHRKRTRYAPFATSLRMSDIGYTSRVQEALSISYDSLDAHLRDLSRATSTCNPDYLALSDDVRGQLSPNFLQIENELYRPFRLQQNRLAGETLVDALRRCGTGRIEIRLLDIDPDQPCGVDVYAAGFLHLAILDCLVQPSPLFADSEWQELNEVHHQIAWRGREQGLTIPNDGTPTSFRDLGKSYCESLAQLAEKLDAESGSNFYGESLLRQIEKWDAPENTPSGKQLSAILDGDKDFLELGLELAQKHRNFYRSYEANGDMQRVLAAETERSVVAYRKLNSKECPTG